MKKLFVLIFILIVKLSDSQTPQRINYQAVARDGLGNIVTNPIGIKFEIFQGSVGGTLVYEETHTTTPASSGIFTVHIGGGSPVSGNFNSIMWGIGTYYLRVNIDPAGGTSYSTVGASQLVAVPYALFAEKTTPPLLGITPAGSVNILSVGPSTIAIPAGGSTNSPTLIGVPPVSVTAVPSIGTPTAYIISSTATGTSVVTPTLQINSPHSITNLGPGNNSITIQPTNLTGTGAASVTGSYPNYNVNVPYPSISINTGTISIISGTYVSTATLSSIVSPWTKTGNQIYAVNPGDSVGIGTTTPTSKLEIYARGNARGIYVDVLAGTTSNTNAIAFTATSANNGYAPTARIFNFGNGNALDVSKNSSSGSVAVFNNTVSTNANVAVDISNNGTGAALNVNSNGSSGNAANFNHNGNGRTILATNNSANDAVFVFQSGTGNSINSKNTNSSPLKYAGLFDGNVYVLGKTTGPSNYAFEVVNSASVGVMKVRDDGFTGINLNTLSPSARLHVLEATLGAEAILGVNNVITSSANAHGVKGFSQNSSNLSAGIYGTHASNGMGVYGINTSSVSTSGMGVYGITQGLTTGNVGVRGDAQSGAAYGVMGVAFGTGHSVVGIKPNTVTNGSAGRFEINNTVNPDDGVYIQTYGLGTAIHTKNMPTSGANNLGILVEEAHLGSFAPVTTTIGTTGCTACTAATMQSHSNDIAGTFSFNMSGNYAATFSYPITFIKPYRKKPVVIITAASNFAANANYYITLIGGPGNYTGYTINFPGGISPGGAATMAFNYMIIEGSN